MYKLNCSMKCVVLIVTQLDLLMKCAVKRQFTTKWSLLDAQ